MPALLALLALRRYDCGEEQRGGRARRPSGRIQDHRAKDPARHAVFERESWADEDRAKNGLHGDDGHDASEKRHADGNAGVVMCICIPAVRTHYG